ncbi:hypothetical protein HBH70_064460 [Parastagonospora nodorum]|nr:hypothetical protein HBI10_049970 [Parastagonospora nodorum]KAH4018466.1 hypothetical protein HBI13_133140 [Parastagonospora nodorum]KAH4072045.1 hypothetical protein HBH50_071930 [Parastagonospora nodorum]KAH4094929.1 hypothetical protein HBH48_060190 [Parastagonospora nodorum]KAH4130056.1 hypothetical protein HBH47_023380 [Parastagonospora nodorum]
MPRKRRDPESTIHQLPNYPSLAAFIASDRDRTTLIYKRFNPLAALPRPSKSIMCAFREVFKNQTDGKGEPSPTLGGHGAAPYDDIDDLVALRVQETGDRLTDFAHEHLAILFPDRKRTKKGIAYASDRAISSFVAWFSTFLAALLLIGAIVVLYTVHSPDWRLGLIATFTTLFAGSVGLLTNARRVELFAATAAYAAVLVVFVSGDLGGSQNG